MGTKKLIFIIGRYVTVKLSKPNCCSCPQFIVSIINNECKKVSNNNISFGKYRIWECPSFHMS